MLGLRDVAFRTLDPKPLEGFRFQKCGVWYLEARGFAGWRFATRPKPETGEVKHGG